MANEITTTPNEITLENREILKKIYYWIIWLTLLAEIILIRVKVVHHLDENWYIALAYLIIGSSVPLTILIKTFFQLRPRIFSTTIISDDGIKIQYKKKVRAIPVQEILRVQIYSTSPRFWGGFRIHLSSGHSFFFPFFLVGSEKVLERVLREKPEVMSEEAYLRYCQLSHFVDISWGRIRDKFKKPWLIMSKYLFLPIAMGSFATLTLPNPDKSISWMSFFGWNLAVAYAGVFFIGFILNHIEERFYNSRLDANDPKRDFRLEKYLIYVSNTLFFIVISIFIYLWMR